MKAGKKLIKNQIKILKEFSLEEKVMLLYSTENFVGAYIGAINP